MTLDDLKRQSLLQTRGIANTCAESSEALHYIISCVNRFFSGDYGEAGKEDIALNNRDLREGEGYILAKYEAQNGLEDDIYIEAHFSTSVPGIDANNTMIMYCNER